MSTFALPPNPPGGFVELLGLELDPATPEQARSEGVRGRLTVDERHHMPMGTVHGGVWCGVVETAASIGASLAVLDQGKYAVGVDNTTDFLRPMRSGPIDVVAVPVQIGRAMQLWEVTITDATNGKIVARGRLRVANQDLPG